MKRFLGLISILLLIGCGGGGSGTTTSYSLIIAGSPAWTMSVTINGSNASFTMSGEGMSFSGSGTISGDTAVMTGTIAGLGEISSTVNFNPDRQSFTGSYVLSDGGTPATVISSGSLMGSTTDWTAFTASLPQFVTDDYIDLTRIDQLSLFRSSAGHDYSDSYESCRSMKHYFRPFSSDPYWDTIPVYSPVAGTAVSVTTEMNGASYAGIQLTIESQTNPGIYFVIFHMDPTTTISLGDTFTAGELIGTHVGNITSSDIAVGIYLGNGNLQLVSFFDVMDSTYFTTNYVTPNTNISGLSDLVISQTDRDNNALVCNGEEFDPTSQSSDPLNAYVTLGIIPPP